MPDHARPKPGLRHARSGRRHPPTAAGAIRAAARIVAMSCCASSVALLSSCGTTPELPHVDDSVRRPVNTSSTIELLRCKAELSQSRAAEAEAAHASARAQALTQAALQKQPAREPACQSAPAQRSGPTTVYVVPFAFGSASWQPDATSREQLAPSLRDAELIVVRGRTDGALDSPSEIRLARRRAEAVAAWLQGQGVASSRLRMQWQAGASPSWAARWPGDEADLRRTEIEIHGTVPRIVGLATGQGLATAVNPAVTASTTSDAATMKGVD